MKVNSSLRCKLVGIDAFGNRTSGFVSCPVTCDSCSIDTPPVETQLPPVEPEYSEASVCQDDPSWKEYDKKKSKSCNDNASEINRKIYSKCSELGAIDNITSSAFKSCPAMCNVCEFGETSEECKDDELWHHIDRYGKEHSCEWVSDNPIDSCREEGIDRNGKETLAYQSCRKTCDTCISGVCQDNPNWKRWRGNERIRCSELLRLEDKYEPCERVGIADGKTTISFQSCPLLCRTCKSGETAPAQCKDDEQWRHIGQRKSCNDIASDVGKCKEVGIDRNGETTTGYQACQKTCGTCARFKSAGTATNDNATTTEYAEDFVCEDNPNWSEKKKKGKTCSDLASEINKKIQSKCSEMGEVNGIAASAFKSCPVICNMCEFGEDVPEVCEDDEDWHQIGSSSSSSSSALTCELVGEDPKEKV